MTTSQKITGAFVIVIAILAILSFMSYTGLLAANEDYNANTRTANIDVAASDTARLLNRATTNVALYMRTGDPATLETAQAGLAEAVVVIDGAIALSLNEANRAEMEGVKASVLAYTTNLTDRARYRSNSIADFTDNVRPKIAILEVDLVKLANMSFGVGNVAVLKGAADCWPILANFRTYSNRFIETEELVDGESSATSLENLGKILGELGSLITTYEGRQLYTEMDEAYKALSTAFVSTRERVVNSRNASIEGAALLAETRNQVDGFNVIFAEFRVQENINYSASNAASLNQTLIVTALGMLVAAGFALFIIFSLGKTLKKLSVYSTHIANGNFKADSGVTEKGAIGEMVKGMKAIPDALNSIIDNASSLSGNIMSGNYRERLDTATYKGDFETLGESLNSIANAYTDAIDLMPNPIMSCTQEHAITFLNKAAQSALGGNPIGEKCTDHFRTKECNSSDCFGSRACSTNTGVAGITQAVLNGKSMDIAVMATPLVDAQNNVLGYLEIITDLTEIKSQERMILKTAAEASEIADRVAAASEELSAQFEQISRGTDQQKLQVESTASAMSEMNSTVLEVARNTSQASTQTEDTRQKADDGAVLVNKVMQSINDVNKVANTLQTNMQELGTQAENIGSVMNVISDIADQTNLLALNAAIEAARAGDAGRGFAVVADEVRKLAEKTMQATHEVGESITAIQKSAHTNIDEMATAITSISDATGLANDSGIALGEIVELATSNSAIVTSIATAAEEQSSTSEEINVSIEEISQVVADITISMEQSTEAVRELSSMAQDLRSLMEKLR